MMERLEGAALPLILTLALLADGLMEALGPSGFALVSAITLTAVEALRLLAGVKRKPPRALRTPRTARWNRKVTNSKVPPPVYQRSWR